MNFLHTGPDDAPAALLLAHGAGAPMDSRFMNDFAALMAEHGLRTSRFEFAYMAGRRSGAGRKPPPRAERRYRDQRVRYLLTSRRVRVGQAKLRDALPRPLGR